jgi:hypothetical protein
VFTLPAPTTVAITVADNALARTDSSSVVISG